MNRNLLLRMLSRAMVTVFVLAVFVETQALACPVCYGDKESAEVEGARWAIFFLLGVTGTVLSGVVAFVVHLRRRARNAPPSTAEVPNSN